MTSDDWIAAVSALESYLQIGLNNLGNINVFFRISFLFLVTRIQKIFTYGRNT